MDSACMGIVVQVFEEMTLDKMSDADIVSVCI